MDPMIIPTVASVLSSLKNARDLVKDTSNKELRDQISEAYDGLLDLKARLLDLDEENRQLKAALAKKGEIEGPIPPFGYFYKVGDREHPLCPKCYQSKDPREAFMGAPHTYQSGSVSRTCTLCPLEIMEKTVSPTYNQRTPGVWA